MTSLKQHLAQEHKLSPSAQYISEIVYGGIDGIVTTFAVVAGFAGAGSESAISQIGTVSVVLFGLANLFGDGVSMALGRYLSTRSEQDVYYTAWQKEQYEIINNSDLECQESIEILINQGMSHQDASNYITILKQYPDLWTKWMMDNELEIPDIRNAKPLLQSLITLCSFIFFGTIPLAPYIFWNSGGVHRESSIIMTFTALFVLGTVRRGVTRISYIKTVLQIMILGGVAATVAYYTGEMVIKYFA